MNELLDILRVIFPQFAKDSRTLLKIPSSCLYEFKSVPPGFYCHINIEDGLHRIINNNLSMQKYLMQNVEIVLPLNININGLPISKSLRSQFYSYFHRSM